MLIKSDFSIWNTILFQEARNIWKYLIFIQGKSTIRNLHICTLLLWTWTCLDRPSATRRRNCCNLLHIRSHRAWRTCSLVVEVAYNGKQLPLTYSQENLWLARTRSIQNHKMIHTFHRMDLCTEYRMRAEQGRYLEHLDRRLRLILLRMDLYHLHLIHLFPRMDSLILRHHTSHRRISCSRPWRRVNNQSTSWQACTLERHSSFIQRSSEVCGLHLHSGTVYSYHRILRNRIYRVLLATQTSGDTQCSSLNDVGRHMSHCLGHTLVLHW